MSTPKYSINSEPISSILVWINSGEIAIPEIQRPFVWSPTKVRDLLDSLLKGFPVGYIIMWQNPTVKLKTGGNSMGKRILIDGQQRITALMASLLGIKVVTKDYNTTRIVIAFQPQEKRFEVSNPAIQRDTLWISDIATIFRSDFKQHSFVNEYCKNNPDTDPDELHESISNLLQIRNNTFGIILLDGTLDIETVTEIFIRVNSAGVPLGQADFAMSRIAVNETYNGANLRKAIDYFCHIAKDPNVYQVIVNNDNNFANSIYFQKIGWLRHENDELYDPAYDDMLRVAFTSEFQRGRLKDLVALLSGRNFETRQHEERIIEDTFSRLNEGIINFMNKNNFKSFIMIISSSGFIDSSLISSQMALNFAYILYLTLRKQGINNADIERYVRQWFVMSVLTSRYSSNIETNIERDINQIHELGIQKYAEIVIAQELSDTFWNVSLPRDLNTSSSNSPFFSTFCAAQVNLNVKGFLSRDISVRDLITYKSNVHHLFPRDLLKKAGMSKNQYNQIANYVITQSEINIKISNKHPQNYFREVFEQVNGGEQRYGNITTVEELEANFEMNCIPSGVENLDIGNYEEFLEARRMLMAQKIRRYFESLR